jgi:hypothetical protein
MASQRGTARGTTNRARRLAKEGFQDRSHEALGDLALDGAPHEIFEGFMKGFRHAEYYKALGEIIGLDGALQTCGEFRGPREL